MIQISLQFLPKTSKLAHKSGNRFFKCFMNMFVDHRAQVVHKNTANFVCASDLIRPGMVQEPCEGQNAFLLTGMMDGLEPFQVFLSISIHEICQIK